MGRKLIRWQWRYFCEIRKKHITTARHLPEDLIRIEHPDAMPVPGTMIEIDIEDDPMANSTSAFLREVKVVKPGD